MLEALVAFLVPLEVPDHLLLLAEHLRVALQAVEMFSVGGREGGQGEAWVRENRGDGSVTLFLWSLVFRILSCHDSTL